MNYKYETDGGIKFVEEDSYEHGCDPNTAQEWTFGHSFLANTIEDLVLDIMDYFQVERNAIELDSCDDAGRIDVQVMEDQDGEQPNPSQVVRWKQGKAKMWAATYTFRVTNNETGTEPWLTSSVKWEGTDN